MCGDRRLGRRRGRRRRRPAPDDATRSGTAAPTTTARTSSPGACAIGFRRLSIIDLAGGSPAALCSEDGSVVATCNGEIYNFQALRAELEARGHTFAHRLRLRDHPAPLRGVGRPLSSSDLRGMFAIALWDADARRLLLARDRLGVKPLYYAEVDGRHPLRLASPARSSRAASCAARPDPVAIAQYLALQYVPPPLSGFHGIRKLAPGELLRARARRGPDRALLVRSSRWQPRGDLRRGRAWTSSTSCCARPRGCG